MSLILFILIYVLFRATILNSISSKIISSLHTENKYEEYKENKIKKYFDKSFVLFSILYIISKEIDSILFTQYFDIIPIIYLFYKLVCLYK